MKVACFGDQVEAMKQGWPSFKVVRNNSKLYVWEGPLKPLFVTYKVHVRMRKGNICPALATAVQVIDPLLRSREEEPQVPIPHIYGRDPTISGNSIGPYQSAKPFLCLYFGSELQCSDIIADTIVPWTIDWLVVYEFWLATGRWLGGGIEHKRH